jgi:hypothetical protein
VLLKLIRSVQCWNDEDQAEEKAASPRDEIRVGKKKLVYMWTNACVTNEGSLETASTFPPAQSPTGFLSQSCKSSCFRRKEGMRQKCALKSQLQCLRKRFDRAPLPHTAFLDLGGKLQDINMFAT